MTHLSDDAHIRLELAGISKAFPRCQANDNINLKVRAGEIHALLGENGAGKSTLMKIIYGLLHADKGVMRWEGDQITSPNPTAARKLGIAMIFQHFSLFESLSVAENIALAMDGSRPMAGLTKDIHAISKNYGLPLEPARAVFNLSVGERQRVEIVRCLLQKPRLLIMDEPTSVLTPQEIAALFETLRQLAKEGVSILYISHKLEEVRALCSTATILRAGKVSGVCDPTKESALTLAEMMIGRALKPTKSVAKFMPGAVILQVQNLSHAAHAIGAPIKSTSLTVRAGEIVGIAGVAGNGQNTLMAALSGETLVENAENIKYLQQAIGHWPARKRRAMGLCYVPEERMGHGAVPEMTLIENTVLSGYLRQSLLKLFSLFLRLSRARKSAKKVMDDFHVVAQDSGVKAKSLSGGNLQKFILGREIMQDPKLLILAHPTWGVDAGAAARIHQEMLAMKEKGTAILVVSQDLDELLAITDSIAVMFNGRLSKTYPTADLTSAQIGLMMGGVFDNPSEQVG